MKLFVVNNAVENLKPSFTKIVEAVNTQVQRDFGPIWSVRAEVTPASMPRRGNASDLQKLKEAEAFVFVSSDPAGSVAAGKLRARSFKGISAAFVTTQATDVPWTVSLSAAVLQLLIDPHLNHFALAPHPITPDRLFFHPRNFVFRPYEVCDPVHGCIYKIGNIEVSEFVTPRYFSIDPKVVRHEVGRTFSKKLKIEPFGVLGRGHFSYFDPNDHRWLSYPEGPATAKTMASKAAQSPGLTRADFRRVEGAKGWGLMTDLCDNATCPGGAC
jgi:hypothetical protein